MDQQRTTSVTVASSDVMKVLAGLICSGGSSLTSMEMVKETVASLDTAPSGSIASYLEARPHSC